MVSSQRLHYRPEDQRRPYHLGMIYTLMITIFGLHCWYKEHQRIGREMAEPQMSNQDILARVSNSNWSMWRQGEVRGLTPLVEKTLVIYSAHDDMSLVDKIHQEILQFFLKVGVGEHADPKIDYIFLVPQAPAAAPENVKGRRRDIRHAFPFTPNIRVLERANDCLGSSGLRDVLVDTSGSTNDDKGSDIRDNSIENMPLNVETLLSRYTHFVFLDSSMRGPFLPRYMRPRSTSQLIKPWTDVFTNRLGSQIKLVGRTVSCEIEMHVQAPVWATDRVGLQLLLEHGVLDCATNPITAQRRHELAATRVILGAGYGVDCLMLRYQGLNLTRIREMELPCSARDNPTFPLLNDGLPINPLEVVFVLATPQLLASDPLLRRYTKYLLGSVDVQENEITTKRGQAVLEARRMRLATLVSNCGATLDYAHLSLLCPECTVGFSPEEAQRRFIEQSVLQEYDYRFTVAETDMQDLPYHYCESFLRYQAPDLTS